jgi:hypothetical protein
MQYQVERSEASPRILLGSHRRSSASIGGKKFFS